MSSESIQDNTEETNGRMVRKRQRIMDYFVVADNATRSDTASASASSSSIPILPPLQNTQAPRASDPPHQSEGGRQEVKMHPITKQEVSEKTLDDLQEEANLSRKLEHHHDLPTDEEDEIPLVQNRRKRLSLMRRGHFKEEYEKVTEGTRVANEDSFIDDEEMTNAGTFLEQDCVVGELSRMAVMRKQES
ncbi:hypothetical protein BC829DRAFT_418166 [Chytridium lagenaria]|nr:hypothetical protein BC829DRAFT_418166 [Chytridium lagenaria]